jgi:TRAP-type C4-dicarboxylate transport system permease small subunit
MSLAMPLSPVIRLEALVIRAVRVVLGLGLIALVIINVANALGRYTGAFSLVGADELLVYGMIWIVMLGAILAARERSHLSINLLSQRLTSRGAALLQVVVDGITLLTSGFIAYHSLSFIERIASIGQTSMALGVPMTVPHSAVFVGFAGIAGVTLLLLAADFSRLLTRGR